MSTRLDLVLQKFPDHEAAIRDLAARDPSGNLKYLDWGARMLAAGQALAPEIADVLDLFHRFAGQWLDNRAARAPHVRRTVLRETDRVHPDLYTYRPQDFATLRTLLFKLRRARDRKQKKREKLYRIEGAVEADVIYDSSDLVVRHIKNKQASVHYGLGTKWCISMLREGYFNDYEVQNATFFFFERKTPVGDAFDKLSLMLPRGWDADGDTDFAAFTATDERVGLLRLAEVYGRRIFDILARTLDASDQYPASAMSCVYAGTATAEQIEAVFSLVVSGNGSSVAPYKTGELLEAICCNDAAPTKVLEEIRARAVAIVEAAYRRAQAGLRRRVRYYPPRSAKMFPKTIEAALAIHPAITADVREKIVKRLRQRRVNVNLVRRVVHRGRIEIRYDVPSRGRIRYHRRTRFTSVAKMRAHAAVLDRRAARMRRSARKLQLKLAAAKRKKLAKKKRP